MALPHTFFKFDSGYAFGLKCTYVKVSIDTESIWTAVNACFT